MKFTAEVVAALEVLRAAAENDFERHRIDVLEKDLHEPPKVEIIDDNRQMFNGKIYYRHKTDRFRTNETIHRDIWSYCFGKILEGYHIHHVDGNTANNALSNLQCLDQVEHGKIHSDERPANKATCVVCGKEFTTRKLGGAKYCSKSCRRKARRNSGVDDVTKICPVCGKEFTSNLYDETTTCSRECAELFKKNRQEKITAVCAYCGKFFETTKKNPAKCCSRLCRSQYYRKTHREERTCVICGNKFQCNTSSSAQTCSRKCRAQIIWQSRRANNKTVTD